MEKKAEILSLLSRKKELLVVFETVTSGMLYEDRTEELEASIDQRQDILDKLMVMDRQIRQICAGDAALLQVLNHQCDRGGLRPELEELYDASLAVKAVANRIQSSDAAVVEHMELARESLKEKIEEINSGGYAVASKYYRAAQTGVARMVLDERNKKI